MNTLTRQEMQGIAFEPQQPEIEQLDLVRYWRAIARNKWRIVALVALVGLIATLYAFSLKPIYRATATVLVEGSRPKTAGGPMMEDPGTSRDYFLTQFEIIKSRGFAERAVRVMGLTKHPEFDGSLKPMPWYAALMPASGGAAGSPAKAPLSKDAEDDAFDGVVGAVMGGTSLQPVRNTQLVKISFDSGDPELAARVPNTLGHHLHRRRHGIAHGVDPAARRHSSPSRPRGSRKSWSSPRMRCSSIASARRSLR